MTGQVEAAQHLIPNWTVDSQCLPAVSLYIYRALVCGMWKENVSQKSTGCLSLCWVFLSTHTHTRPNAFLCCQCGNHLQVQFKWSVSYWTAIPPPPLATIQYEGPAASQQKGIVDPAENQRLMSRAYPNKRYSRVHPIIWMVLRHRGSGIFSSIFQWSVIRWRKGIWRWLPCVPLYWNGLSSEDNLLCDAE